MLYEVITNVYDNTEKIDKFVNNAVAVISDGKVIVEDLNDKTNQSYQITNDVISEIINLADRITSYNVCYTKLLREGAIKEIKSVLEATKAHNCNTEIVLNIGGTLGANPRQKVVEWSQMVRELINQYY